MTMRIKSAVAALAVSVGLAAVPASAQVFGTDRGVGSDYGRAPGYHEDGTLNVFGAHIDPRAASGGGALGGVGNAVGGVVGGVGTAVGGVVGGVTGAADDVVTGSIGGRRAGYGESLDRPASRYSRSAY